MKTRLAIFSNFVVMKKAASIVLSVLLIASVFHLSLATHYCEGDLAAVKVSLDGELASCGMPEHFTNRPGTSLDLNCCTDHLSTFAVDQQYSPSLLNLDVPVQKIIHSFFIPVAEHLTSNQIVLSFIQPGSPPDVQFPNTVAQESICVFRI